MSIKSKFLLLFMAIVASVVLVTTPALAQGKGKSGSIEVLITTQTYIGDLGGPYGATAKCQLEFKGSRFCSYKLDGLRLLTNLPDFHGENFAWVDALEDEVDPPGDNNCQNWTYNYGDNTSALRSDGLHIFYYVRCEDPYPIACCRN